MRLPVGREALETGDDHLRLTKRGDQIVRMRCQPTTDVSLSRADNSELTTPNDGIRRRDSQYPVLTVDDAAEGAMVRPAPAAVNARLSCVQAVARDRVYAGIGHGFEHTDEIGLDRRRTGSHQEIKQRTVTDRPDWPSVEASA